MCKLCDDDAKYGHLGAEMTNTEPGATPRTAELMARQFDEARKIKDGLPREEIAAAWIDLAMELESALLAERERADRLELALKAIRQPGKSCMPYIYRAEKAEAELAALKEALRNPTPEMIEAGAKVGCEQASHGAHCEEVLQAMTAHLLKD